MYIHTHIYIYMAVCQNCVVPTMRNLDLVPNLVRPCALGGPGGDFAQLVRLVRAGALCAWCLLETLCAWCLLGTFCPPAGAAANHPDLVHHLVRTLCAPIKKILARRCLATFWLTRCPCAI